MAVYYEPVEIGKFVLPVGHPGLDFPFTTLEGVIIPEAKVDVYFNNTLFKTYTIGDGLVLTGTNTQGVSKTLTLTLIGADYATKAGFGYSLQAKCSFLVEGEINMVFDLKVSE